MPNGFPAGVIANKSFLKGMLIAKPASAVLRKKSLLEFCIK
jgi:hypothetical protein